MTRHAMNTNLTLHFDNSYFGLPVMWNKGPFIAEYLNRLHQTMARSLDQYNRVFAFRFDLRLPAGNVVNNSEYPNEVVDRFIDSFKAKIRHNRQMATRENPYAHDTVVRYVWARELNRREHPHYHFVIFLNYDAFCALGKFVPDRDNIFNRLNDAWASALGLPREVITGLVEIPNNPGYVLYRNDDESLQHFFHRSSYLCKSATKVFGDGSHGFGASRN